MKTMKKTLFTMALILAAATAQAEAFKGHYVIDMSGREFHDDTFNLMDDGINIGDGDLQGFAVKLDGVYGRDFTVSAKGSEPKVECGFKVLAQPNRQTLIKLEAGVETDTGEMCRYTFQYNDGHKATLSVYEEGT